MGEDGFYTGHFRNSGSTQAPIPIVCSISPGCNRLV